MKHILDIAKDINNLIIQAKKDFDKAKRHQQYSAMAEARAFENGVDQALEIIRVAIIDDLNNNPKPIIVSSADLNEIGINCN